MEVCCGQQEVGKVGNLMDVKIRLKFADILKLMFGYSILVLNPLNGTVMIIQKGEDTYVCK